MVTTEANAVDVAELSPRLCRLPWSMEEAETEPAPEMEDPPVTVPPKTEEEREPR